MDLRAGTFRPFEVVLMEYFCIVDAKTSVLELLKGILETSVSIVLPDQASSRQRGRFDRN